MDIIHEELRADYRRMAGIELTEDEVTELAWEAALEDAHDEVADWQDEWRWETGPGPGYDDTPENNGRITAHRERELKTVVLPVHGGGYREYRADLTHAQRVALRGLTLTDWIQSMATHSDRQLKTGFGPFTIIVCDTDDRAHVMRLETDGRIIHTRPRA